MEKAIQGRNCGKITESKIVYDFVICSCGKCSVGGDNAYLGRLTVSKGSHTELSILI
ncbi:DUF7695 domain-containing protein [Eisenbergiella tayi]|uniref:DUF7695 domain-containing protein n=1 Tax=Eisenbergiella tayi TaxID=1432052 RepID=UPI003AB91D57